MENFHPLCGQRHLKLDEACLSVSGSPDLRLWAQSTECYKCRPWLAWSDTSSNFKSVIVNTTWSTNLTVVTKTDEHVCDVIRHFKEFERSTIDLNDCNITTEFKGVNIYLPILYLLSSIGVIILAKSSWNRIQASRCCRVRQVNRQLGSDASEETNDNDLLVAPTESETHDPSPRTSQRLRSLDTFRGLAVILMIFVNYGGGGYWFFKHSPWNGLTVADLVFPWFLWIMGVSMTLSLDSQLNRQGKSRWAIFKKICSRSIILFGLGIFVNSKGQNDFRTLRIPGVLQRFAISYFVTASLEVLLASRQTTSSSTWWSRVSKVTDGPIQWVVMVLVAALHLGLSLCLPVPGCPTGYVGPGGAHLGGLYANCTGGAAGHIDRMIFGLKHMYKHCTAHQVYNTMMPFDPEGALGCLNSIITVFLGVQCGRILLNHQNGGRISRMLAWFFILGMISGVSSGFSLNDGFIPINKNLWSISYVTATTSMAFLLLSILYLVIDGKSWWGGAPFAYAGMNPIALYVGHEICKGFFPFAWKPFFVSHCELFFMNLWGCSGWLMIAIIMYRKGIFISV